jgi:ABC-2 type transport system permease protein
MSSATAGWRSSAPARTLGAMWAGARLQLAIIRTHPDYWMVTAATPLLGVVFLAVVREAGRDDLVAGAVLAPVLYGLVAMSLSISGETVESDRWAGTLEAAIATPTPLAVPTFGRVAAVTALASVGFAVSWSAAWAVFGVVVAVPHPVVFGLAVFALLFAMAATALLMSGVFVLARSARVFQNSLSFPLYVLGGVVVPVTFLPGWLEPVARLVFLSWSSDLLRDALDPNPVEAAAPRLALVAAMGLVTLELARRVMVRIVDRARRLGSVTYA